jgi:hypothetical protein
LARISVVSTSCSRKVGVQDVPSRRWILEFDQLRQQVEFRPVPVLVCEPGGVAEFGDRGLHFRRAVRPCSLDGQRELHLVGTLRHLRVGFGK